MNTPEIKKDKRKSLDAGFEIMFPISSSNQQRLSDMADNKAAMLITVNSIILSAVISLLLTHLTGYFTFPVFLQILVSLTTMIFAVLITRPKLCSGKFAMNEVQKGKVNLLFFGNFCKMSLHEYSDAIQEQMQDSNRVYASLIIDEYAEGVILEHKYRLLRICYNVFMFGIIISIAAFILAFFLNGSLTNISLPGVDY